MESVTLDIKGMTCMGCVNSVTRVLKASTGVSKVRVTLDPAQASVQYDALLTSLAKLKAVVEDAGYAAS